MTDCISCGNTEWCSVSGTEMSSRMLEPNSYRAQNWNRQLSRETWTEERDRCHAVRLHTRPTQPLQRTPMYMISALVTQRSAGRRDDSTRVPHVVTRQCSAFRSICGSSGYKSQCVVGLCSWCFRLQFQLGQRASLDNIYMGLSRIFTVYDFLGFRGNA